MEVGIGPLGDMPGSRAPPAGLTSEVVTTARRADELGFDAVWLGERHFAHETVTASAPFTLAAAVAQATTQVRIGTAVSILPLHHPVRLAEQVAMLDAISDGRVTLGGGIGYLAAEYETFGADPDRRVAELLDAVEVLDAAVDHAPLDFDGRLYTVDDVRIEPAFTQDPRPPIWLGGTVPASMRRAAAVADGFIGVPMGTGFYRGMYDTLTDSCDNYDEFGTAAMVNVFVADSTAAAIETVSPGLAYLERRYARWMGFDPPSEPDTSSGVYGTPAEVIDGLQTYADILGPDVHLLVRLHYPAVDRAASDHAMDRFADEVLPALD